MLSPNDWSGLQILLCNDKSRQNTKLGIKYNGFNRQLKFLFVFAEENGDSESANGSVGSKSGYYWQELRRQASILRMNQMINRYMVKDQSQGK